MDTPFGYCECGCGGRTKLSPKTDPRHGYVKGRPRRFIKGHAKRMPQTWLEEDHGYITPCWIWQGGRSGNYGWAQGVDGFRATFAHIMAYQREHGAIPPGHHLHHLCEQPLCVRPDHIATKTRSEHAKIHRPRTGRRTRLSAEQLAEIRGSDLPLQEIMARYGVSKSHASRLRGLDPRPPLLTGDQVREIVASTEPHAVIAQKYGVTTVYISHIKNGWERNADSGIPARGPKSRRRKR